MTIDRLSALSAQFAALRAELLRKNGKSERARAAEHTDESQVDESVLQRDSGALRKQLADIVRGLSMDDAEALVHVRKRVVKAVLLWEFGHELREHPEWQPMVDKVAGTLDMDEGFRNAFNRLIADLQV